jgi:hypothetical protein
VGRGSGNWWERWEKCGDWTLPSSTKAAHLYIFIDQLPSYDMTQRVFYLKLFFLFFGGFSDDTRGWFAPSKRLPIEPILLWLFWRWDFGIYLPRLASHHSIPDLSLTSS